MVTKLMHWQIKGQSISVYLAEREEFRRCGDEQRSCHRPKRGAKAAIFVKLRH